MDTRMTKRRNFSDQFKAAVALEALRGDKTVQEIAAKRQLHPTQVSVRRQGFWDQWLPKLRESLAHLVGLIMRRVVCDASVAFRVSFV